MNEAETRAELIDSHATPRVGASSTAAVCGAVAGYDKAPTVSAASIM
jgi:hypothetical protein